MESDTEIFDVFAPSLPEDPAITIRRRAFLAFFYFGKIGEEFVADPGNFSNTGLWRDLAHIAMFPEYHTIL